MVRADRGNPPAILRLVSNGVRLAPSILAADFARLGEQVAEAEVAGADLIHVDVMDGRFVPNITLGPAVLAAVRRSTSLPLDVHLMIVEPERHVEAFVAAGAGTVTVHAEVAPQLHRVLAMVRESGTNAGLAVNPLTPLDVFAGALPYLDTALVMSVDPGFGGQDFIPATLDRIRALRRLRDRINPGCLIEVDGGIDADTARMVVKAGANVLVAGSAVFGGLRTVAENLAALRTAAVG